MLGVNFHSEGKTRLHFQSAFPISEASLIFAVVPPHADSEQAGVVLKTR